MKYFKNVRRLTLNDLTEFFTAIARFPYFGGFLSLISALYDLYDIVTSLFNKKLLEKKVVISIAFSRMCGHTLIGLGSLVPLVSIAAFMVFHPCFIPLVALYIASAELYKFCKLVNTAYTTVLANENKFKENPTQILLNELKESREILYQAKQERIINIGLLIGALLGLVGLLFPPLLTIAVAVSLTSAVLGIVDKRYRLSEKVSHFIFGNQDIRDEQLLKQASIDMPVVKKHPAVIVNQTTKKTVNYPPPASNTHPARFFYTQPDALAVAPALVGMRNYR